MAMTPESPAAGPVIVLDDQKSIRDSLRALLESADLRVLDYATATAFLAAGPPEPGACLLLDIRMPGMTGLELQEELVRRNTALPLIIMTGHADVALAVKAMKAGAMDFLEKPFDDEWLLAGVRRALAAGRRKTDDTTVARAARERIALLTPREREVMGRLEMGESNKLIAFALGISPRTVEIYRANVHDKLGARGLADVVRTVRAAGLAA
jgi:two-component system response regulator FixJ